MEKATPSWFHAVDGKTVPVARVDGKRVRLFECLFCDKTFFKSQALGGHQNAHRGERHGCFFNDPYGDGSFGASTLLFSTAPSSGRSMRTSIATHGRGVAASTPAADGRRPERWSDPSGDGGDPVASGAGETLDLELRL